MEQAQAMMAENSAYLDLRRTDVTELSDNLTLDCFLVDMSYMPLTALPEHLTVTGSINLSWSQIITLPEHLTVGRDRHLTGAGATALPDSLRVGGAIWTGCAPLTEEAAERVRAHNKIHAVKIVDFDS